MPALNFFGNNVNASGPMLWVICNALSGAGGMTLEELSTRIQPFPFIEAKGKGRATSSRSMPWLALNQSVNVGLATGLLASDGRRADATLSVNLAEDIVADPDAFRKAVRQAILSGTKEEDGSVVYGDLPLALAWLLGSRAEEPFYVSWGKGPERRMQLHASKLVSNESQWRPFFRWAEFLGFATVYRLTRSKAANSLPVVADPRTAIWDVVEEFPKKLNGVDFAKRLSDGLPVLTGGAVAESLTAGGHKIEADMSDGTRFAPVVSNALLTLAESRQLSFKKKDDDSNRITLRGPTGPVIVDEVTHD